MGEAEVVGSQQSIGLLEYLGSAQPCPARPTHHAQVAQQPVAPGRLGEAAQPATGDVELPGEPQEPQQQAEEEEEQGEQDHRHGIQAEGGLLQPQKVQQVFRDGQHPGGIHGAGVSKGGNRHLATCMPYTQ